MRLCSPPRWAADAVMWLEGATIDTVMGILVEGIAKRA